MILFLHLGENEIIFKNSVLGIFNIGTLSNSKINKEFLEVANSEKKVIQIGSKEKIKTFVVTDDKIYISPISSLTLQKRFNNNNL